jgi:hypothetical protein
MVRNAMAASASLASNSYTSPSNWWQNTNVHRVICRQDVGKNVEA